MAEIIDQKTLAYINMYGVLGGLVALCENVPEARKILGESGTSIGFAVKDGPKATLTFIGGRTLIKEGVDFTEIPEDSDYYDYPLHGFGEEVTE